MADSYLIKGGKPLKGEVILSGAKNVALKTIIASLMFKTPVVLDNIPRINDVLDLIELIKSLGAKAEFESKNRLIVDGSTLHNNKVDLVTPLYRRNRMEGNTTNHLMYPYLFAIYNKKIQQPIGGEFALSKKLVKAKVNPK